MKRWALILFLLILAIFACSYVFIPLKQEFAFVTEINCPQPAAARLIVSVNNWKSWWPGQQSDNNIYGYKNCNYRIEKVLLDGFEATIYDDKDSIKGFLAVVPHGKDSAQFEFTGRCLYSTNPFKRITQYFQFNNLKKNIEGFLSDLRIYFNKQENVYGFKVIAGKVKDSSMISVKQTFIHYPDTKEIYDLIVSVQNYIKEKGGEQVDSPMLNVYSDDPHSYEAMVAVPTKSDLPSDGKFQLKKMVMGNILMAEVKGGVYTVRRGEENLQNYVDDYHKVSPAIPYQSLITNRMKEPDTTKWITRLYYPVFY